MKKYKLPLLIVFILIVSSGSNIHGQEFDMFGGKDLLSETPLYPLPDEMTFEEYQIMNKRISVGLLLSAIPVPGTMHSYAGEAQTAKKIRWVAAGSVLTMIIGAVSMKEGDWEDTEYQIFEEGGTVYEMIPTGEFGGHTTYKYVELKKTYSGGSALIPLGVGVLIADYIYDYIHGIKVIERKRDEVRFKYGKTIDFSFTPTINFQNQTTGLLMTYNF